MVDKLIKDLTQATAIAGTDVLAIDRDTATRKNIVANFFTDSSTIEYTISGATILPSIVANSITDDQIDAITAAVISDFDTEVSNNADVTANTAKVTNATHTGDVTGSDALTIGADKVNNTHIDWGTGTNQVSADDIPDGATNVIITATQETKLDGIETGADVTDTTNVEAAGALMDSELTSIADVKALDQSVVSGASPTLDGTNFSGIPNTALNTGIADNDLVEIDGADITSGEYAKFTAAGLQSKTFAEVKTDLSLNNVDNTSDTNKPVSTAQQSALDGKEDANSNIQAHISSTSNPHGVTKTQLSLENVTNDAQLKIASNLSDVATQQTALNNITNVSAGTDEYVLTKDTTTGDATWKAGGGGGGTLYLEAIAQLTLSADQTADLAVGNHVEFDTISVIPSSGSGISLATGSGQDNGIVTLESGYHYEIVLYTKSDYSDTGGYMGTSIYNITDSAIIGTEAAPIAVDYTGHYDSLPIGMWFLDATSQGKDINFKFEFLTLVSKIRMAGTTVIIKKYKDMS